MSIVDQTLRLRFAEREVRRFHDDVEEWKRDHDQAKSYWMVAELVAKANFIFHRLLDVEMDWREEMARKSRDWNQSAFDALSSVLAEWHTISTGLARVVLEYESEFGSIAEAEEFRVNVNEAAGMLTPDDVFFATDRRRQLVDAALQADQQNQTAPMEW